MELAPEPVSHGAAAVVGEVLARRRGTPTAYAQRHLHRVLASTSPASSPTRSWSSAGPSLLSQLRPLLGEGRAAGDPFARRARAHLDPRLPPSREAMATVEGCAGLPHIGSWEWGGALLALDGFPMTASPNRSSRRAVRVVHREAQQDGIQIVASPESGGAVLRTLREGGLVGLLCDATLWATASRSSSSARPRRCSRARDRRPAHGAALMAAVVYSGPVRTTRA